MSSPRSSRDDGEDGAAAAAVEDEAMTMEVDDAPVSLHGACLHYKNLDDRDIVFPELYEIYAYT
jgi:hypothetical protein